MWWTFTLYTLTKPSQNQNQNQKSFIARYVYTYEEFVLMTEASTVQTKWQRQDKTQVHKLIFTYFIIYVKTFKKKKIMNFLINVKLVWLYDHASTAKLVHMHARTRFAPVPFTAARGRKKPVFVAPEPTDHGAVPVYRSQTLNRWSYTATQRPPRWNGTGTDRNLHWAA